MVPGYVIVTGTVVLAASARLSALRERFVKPSAPRSDVACDKCAGHLHALRRGLVRFDRFRAAEVAAADDGVDLHGAIDDEGSLYSSASVGLAIQA